MKLFFIRQAKLFFIRFRLHKFFNLFSSFNLKLAYLCKLSAWIQKNRRIGYNDFPTRWNYEKRYPFYQWVIEKENLLDAPINYLEFGVANGISFRWFLAQNKNMNSRFYGFDTFTGLPEDFGSFRKGTFHTSNAIPEIDDSRGKFYQGLFQQTLPGFLKELDNDRRTVIMLDADLYSATLFVLTGLLPYLKKDDIIFFDEFAVPLHEFRAYLEFTQSHLINLQLIAAANNYYFTSFKVA